MKIYKREIQGLVEKYLFKGDMVVVYGARQVGKTTLVKNILEKYAKKGKYINCDLDQNRSVLETTNSEKLKMFLGNYKLIVLDEVQRIENVGLVLKIMHDEMKDIQVIATGSSSFDMANKISEPMTGRAKTFCLLPLSMEEIGSNFDEIKVESNLEQFLRFGSYPKIFEKDEENKIIELNELASKYLYRDLLMFESIKKSSLVFKLLQLLALQIGGEISYEEIADKLGINRLTVIKYIDLLEQSFVLFKLNSFSRNRRDEISKSVKIYFWDLGVRNCLLQMFNPLDIRDDVGKLWENFCIVEKLKANNNNLKFVNNFFWRSYGGGEIDLIEERGGNLKGYEFKWGRKRKWKVPNKFVETYPKSEIKLISRLNWREMFE